MNLEEYGDKLINEDLGQLVESNPYFAFIVMSSAIEFIARCRETLLNIQNNIGTRARYVDALNNLNAFAAYCGLNGGTIELYNSLRCGLLHSTLPNSSIKLSSETNDIPNNIIGCVSLYEDIKNAWTEIKSDASILHYLQTNKGLVISNTLKDSKEK